ncbi:MAG: hypothetical protein ABJB86_02805 [Bacteroidota bacterium]
MNRGINPPFPVTFSLPVNGKRQGAHLETSLDAVTYHVFSMCLPDGHHDCFFNNGDGNIRSVNWKSISMTPFRDTDLNLKMNGGGGVCIAGISTLAAGGVSTDKKACSLDACLLNLR